MQKVEITGSSIKRIAVEGALPIQRLSQEAIARTGATTVADLIQNLPAMQGFTIGATAAGTNSGGRTSASIHDIGESYTLVLLNGRRIAPQGSGTSVNLNAIPLSAVERVEILTDGASALYGSDAIAGVINFILKKNMRGGSLEATYGAPEMSGGGKNWNTNISYGLGDLDADRYNIMAAYRHDEQSQTKATDRSFANSSYVPFSRNGNNYVFDRTSPSAAPANVAVAFKDPKAPGRSFNPYLINSGHCAPTNFPSTQNDANTNICGFDSGSTVEIVPESKRDSLFTKGSFKVSENLTAFAEMALSRYDLTARIAANPVPIAIVSTASGASKPTIKLPGYYNTYVAPYLTAAQIADMKTVSANFRMADWGTRDSRTLTDTKHLVLGVEGEVAGWNFESGLTWSQNAIEESYVGGYVKTAQLNALYTNPLFNPFLPHGAVSPDMQTLINDSFFHGAIRSASTTLRGVDTHGSREVFELPGGAASLGLGGDYREYHYEQKPDSGIDAGTIYNLSLPPAYDMKRATYGVFAELLAPLTKSLELSLAARHDVVDAIDNALIQRTMGKKESANTYKISARYQPTQTVLLRGSYGTGFKAPDMLDIAQPLVAAGLTAKSQDCPFPGTEYCRPTKVQYNRMSGGNEGLKAETSKQFTLGFRIEPTPAFTFGADLWDVKINDAVSAVSETQAFAKPGNYPELFTTFKEVATGNTYYAFKTLSLNIGQQHNRGVDWDMTARHTFGFGKFTANLNGTHMILANYTVPGTRNEWTSNMNVFGITDAVTFRNLIKFTGTLESGALTNAIVISYRNGYKDAEATVRNTGTGKDETMRLDVPSYTTVDWQGRYAYNKAITVRAGIKNLFNVEPPLSLRASSGHQVGYDPRYADPTMRSFYITGNYKF
ncbi:TonB-dependent receptor domain-containing protein [Janthinobacterium sp.]|uniref:TonB-dependent receptor domain-containing protein n=1 Tax=Janthinobacterium sp. TaxID=1871054 RepID=UPI00293D5A65|nr:TonB-dependent receptor [Janthinobacterium sp.]